MAGFLISGDVSRSANRVLVKIIGMAHECTMSVERFHLI